MRQGQTIFIPAGWILGMLNPVDGEAFAGNFLASMNNEMQLKAYNIELRLNTPGLFKSPHFETIC